MITMKKFTIAIDGPVGAGKSSVAGEVAKKLDILHLDTGAMYRAFALKAIREGIELTDENALTALAENNLPEVEYRDGSQLTLLDGEDVSGLIRTEEISMATSTVSKYAGVRRAMVKKQQELAKKQSMLLDGRDIGTVVLPDATLKIYLTASPEARARRRFDQLTAKGEECIYEDILADVIKRDQQDMNREVDPLRPADDAQILDTTDMNQEQTVDNIIRRLELKRGRMPKKSEKFTWLYNFVFRMFGFFYRTILPVKVHGLENTLLDAPYILISNHNSLFDPISIGEPIRRYHVRFLGKKELEKNPILKKAFAICRMIPVDRHNMDMAAVRSCLKVLKDKQVLGVFPEGTRHKEGVMQELESGIAMIALRGKAPLLPAYMTSKLRLFRTTHLYYGQPISVSELAARGINKENCEELLETIRKTYRDMVAKHEETYGKKQKKNK